jgi:phosphatidylserine decarboxylase
VSGIRYDDSILNHFVLTVKLAWPMLLLGVVLLLLALNAMPVLAIIPAVFLVFTVFFFRNPRRQAPGQEGAVLAPADGKVIDIDTVVEEDFIKGPCKRITIFLSLHNVHINRAPVSGTIVYRRYRPGKFIPAFKSHASEINEKNYIGIDTGEQKVLMTQITGFVARRIVCWVKEGEPVGRGQAIGAIKFGSCTEVFVPPDTSLRVEAGDVVRAGETILGEMTAETINKEVRICLWE